MNFFQLILQAPRKAVQAAGRVRAQPGGEGVLLAAGDAPRWRCFRGGHHQAAEKGGPLERLEGGLFGGTLEMMNFSFFRTFFNDKLKKKKLQLFYQAYKKHLFLVC